MATTKKNGVTTITRDNRKGPTKSEILGAKMAKSINFKVLENWRQKLGAESYYEMAVDFDTERYYEEKKLVRRSPFQSHVRKNIEHMIWTGVFSEQEQLEYLARAKRAGVKHKHMAMSSEDLSGDDIVLNMKVSRPKRMCCLRVESILQLCDYTTGTIRS